MSIDYWKTKDGRIIPIKDMTTDHIRNAIRMLENKGYVSLSKKQFYAFSAGPDGDGAQDAFQREQDQVAEAPLSVHLDPLRSELKRRLEEESESEALSRILDEIQGSPS